MHLPTEIFEDVIVVHTPEELGAELADAFEARLASFDRRNVVVDLDDTEMIDSRGLSALMSGQRQLRALGGDLKIATTNAVNRKIFEITRLDQHLEVFPSVIDAVKSFH